MYAVFRMSYMNNPVDLVCGPCDLETCKLWVDRLAVPGRTYGIYKLTPA